LIINECNWLKLYCCWDFWERWRDNWCR